MLAERLDDGETEQEQPEPAAPVIGSEFRVHSIDSHGYWINWRIVAGTTTEQLNDLVQREGQLSNWLQSHNYTPDSFGTTGTAKPPVRQAEPVGADPDSPACDDCGGPMEYKTGKAKNGKAWSGYFCIATKDAPQNRKHAVHWV